MPAAAIFNKRREVTHGLPREDVDVYKWGINVVDLIRSWLVFSIVTGGCQIRVQADFFGEYKVIRIINHFKNKPPLTNK